jgi:hypothetical protein
VRLVPLTDAMLTSVLIGIGTRDVLLEHRADLVAVA